MNYDSIYHFVGIKGSGMSALALILHDKSYQVQGSDVEKYFFTQQRLEENNIPMFTFSEDNIKPGLTVIAGNAFGDDHVEIKKAHEMGLPVIRYHDFLGKMMENQISIAVTGSHGKTSTTGLLAHTLHNIAPTSFLIGDGTGVGKKDSEYFMLEACEYRRHFLAYHPDYAIITNVDFDHPDYYKSIDDVFSAFKQFAQQVKKVIFAYGDDEHLRKLEAPVPVVYYGLEDGNEFQAKNIQKTTEGSSFDVYHNGDFLYRYFIPTYGDHNIANALSVIAVAYYEGLDQEDVAEHLETFAGVKRRFSEKKVGDTIIIDDYAHHPVEIEATLTAARQKYPHRRIVAVFQPHTFSRTIALLDEFSEALDHADSVYLSDIFHSAREETGDVKIDDLFERLQKGEEIITEDDVSPLLDHKGDVVIFMGAGDIQKFEYAFEKLLSDTMRTVH